MRKFRMKVNGQVYEVEVEEIGTEKAVVAEKVEVVTPPPVKETALPTGAAMVTAPLPGKILSIVVQVGEKVAENTLLLVLEAMKMENEIFAGKNGVVQEIKVSEGATVEADEVLVVIA